MNTGKKSEVAKKNAERPANSGGGQDRTHSEEDPQVPRLL